MSLESEEYHVQPVRDVFPGLPHVESPLFYQLVEELELTATERQVATD